MKPLLSKQEIEVQSEGRELTITRVLGHKSDIPGSGRWAMSSTKEADGCWACDNWRYSLIFWNKDIGEFGEVNSISIDKEVKDRSVKAIRSHNQDTYRSNPESPVLFAKATHWKARPFVNLLDFLN